MAGISFFELVIIFMIGLIVLGPERLPRVASQLGSWLGQARRMTRVMRRQLEEELNLEKELSIDPRPPAKALPAVPAERDDTYSAAHGPDSVGTGVDTGMDPGVVPGVDNNPAADSAREPAATPGEGQNSAEGEGGDAGEAAEGTAADPASDSRA